MASDRPSFEATSRVAFRQAVGSFVLKRRAAFAAQVGGWIGLAIGLAAIAWLSWVSWGLHRDVTCLPALLTLGGFLATAGVAWAAYRPRPVRLLLALDDHLNTRDLLAAAWLFDAADKEGPWFDDTIELAKKRLPELLSTWPGILSIPKSLQ